MGRRLNVVGSIGTLLVLTVASAVAQTGSHQRPPRTFFIRPQPHFSSPPTPRIHISPEDQQVFRKNAERWLQMSQQERNLMREREQARRDRIRVEADAMLKNSGLSLDDKNRSLFEQRYLQERRRIDRELRQEYELRRQQQLDRLKKEFQPTPQISPGAAGTTAPTGSGSPKR